MTTLLSHSLTRSIALPLSLLLFSCRPAANQDYEHLVDEFAAKVDFNGVIVVAEGDTTLVARAFGHENVEDGIPTNLNSRYQLGSISKWVSSLVVLKLVDQGVLSLDESVSTYLPGYRADNGKRITLDHLLAHRSGLPNDIIAAYQADPSVMGRPLTTEEAVRRYASGDLSFVPGSQFDYSHSNWILVKAVIESSTNKSFADNVRDLLTIPLGLDDTGVSSGDNPPNRDLAIGYDQISPTPERSTETFPEYLVCAGGVYSSAPDLLTLLDALYGGELLSTTAVAKLDSVQSDNEWYAYGGRVRSMDLGLVPASVIWHSGSNGPSKSRVSRVLPNGLTVITLTNSGVEPEETGHLTEQLLGEFYE